MRRPIHPAKRRARMKRYENNLCGMSYRRPEGKGAKRFASRNVKE
jgi:hypothetical protein